MPSQPWLRHHWPAALLREHLGLHPYSLVSLRRTFWRDYLALDRYQRERLSDMGQNHRLGFLHGVVQKHMGPEFYARWLAYVGYTDSQMAGIHYGVQGFTPLLMQRANALFGLMPWWLWIGTPPDAGQLQQGEEIEFGHVGGRGNGP